MAEKTFKFKFTGDAKDLSRATGQVSGDLDSAGGKISKSAKRIAGALAAAFAVDKLISFGTELYNIGAQAELWDSKANIVFGDQVGMVQTWADGAAGAMGMTSRELTGLTANMADLLVPMGATREEAATMSMGVGELSGALSAWSGGTRSATEVNEILAAALLGERDSLKSLGISINQAEVDTRALSLAQADGREEFTQLDQAMATNQLIMEKSTDAQTAWTNGTFDATKKSNELKASIATLKEQLGTALLPVVQKVTAWIVDSLIPALQDFKEWIWPKLQAAHDAFSGWWEDKGPAIVGFVEAILEKWTEMATGFQSLWEGWIKPALDDLMDAVGDLWAELSRAFSDIGGALDGLGIDWQFLGKVVGAAVTVMITSITVGVRIIITMFNIVRAGINVMIAAWNAAGVAVGWFRDKVAQLWAFVAPTMGRIGGIFTTAGSGISSASRIAASALGMLHSTAMHVYNALLVLKNMWDRVRSALGTRLSIPTPRWPTPPSWMRSVGGWFHAGTHNVPGAPGSNVPAMLQAGERVLSVAQTRQQDRGSGGGGGIVVNAYGVTGREMVAEIERAVRDGVRAQWLTTAGVS